MNAPVPLSARLIVFEGVDGSGKTTLAAKLAAHYRRIAPDLPLYADSFPGSLPGSLGEWVYRFHHGRVVDAPIPSSVAPPALQLLHVAAHVDAVLRQIAPTLAAGGNVILDRYWWSTYAYARLHLAPEAVWPIVRAEHPFWPSFPKPIIVYLARRVTLKAEEIDHDTHARLHGYYQEVIKAERESGVVVVELSNDGPLEDTWTVLLRALNISGTWAEDDNVSR